MGYFAEDPLQRLLLRHAYIPSDLVYSAYKIPQANLSIFYSTDLLQQHA